jgi:prephenate dehydrogenase
VAAPSSADVPFARVGLVGCGLIGGSVALALRRRAPSTLIAVVDRPDVAAQALERRVATTARTSVAELTDADLIVLATPVSGIIDALAAIGAAGLTAVVTDVGSTKRQVLDAARRYGVRAFVGGHPMAGHERGGLEHASADLFDGRRWFLVPGEAPAALTVQVASFVRALGAEPQETDAATHDRTMAYVSHLPQIMSTVLMQRVGEAVGPDGLDWAGRGLEDLTRLASSSADVWQSILSTNADFVSEAVATVAGDLTDLGGRLEDPAAVGSRFGRARAIREAWLGDRRRIP